jgi:phytanoyl-CoA hydroxylase
LLAWEGLTPEQLAAFERDGFLVLPLGSARQCDQLRAAGKDVIASFFASWTSGKGTVFETGEQQRVSDAYFLSSGDKVRCFFERRAGGWRAGGGKRARNQQRQATT